MMNFLDAMVKSLKEYINDGMAIYGDYEKAIEYAKEHSCAGPKVWEIVLSDMNS